MFLLSCYDNQYRCDPIAIYRGCVTAFSNLSVDTPSAFDKNAASAACSIFPVQTRPMHSHRTPWELGLRRQCRILSVLWIISGLVVSFGFRHTYCICVKI